MSYDFVLFKSSRENKINLKKKKKALIIFLVADNEPSRGKPSRKELLGLVITFSSFFFLIKVLFSKNSNTRYTGVG